jgi:ribulose-phosphate 3-epimerase
MSVIVPCITVDTLDAYKQQVERLQPFASRVHIDLSDGEFAPNKLLSENEIYWPQDWQVDIHAMVEKPSKHLARLIQLKPSLIIIHAECSENLVATIQEIKKAGIKAGLALQRSTVPLSIAAAIRVADHALIFSGALGTYGGKANMVQIQKARLIRAINPSIEVGWDGGANLDNVYTMTRGGIAVINAGGAIAKADDPQAMYLRLSQEVNKKGVL